MEIKGGRKHEKGRERKEVKGLTRMGGSWGQKWMEKVVDGVARLQLSGKPTGQRKRTTGKRENFGGKSRDYHLSEGTTLAV